MPTYIREAELTYRRRKTLYDASAAASTTARSSVYASRDRPAVEAHKAWWAANPGSFSPSSEIVAAYQDASRALEAMGLDNLDRPAGRRRSHSSASVTARSKTPRRCQSLPVISSWPPIITAE